MRGKPGARPGPGPHKSFDWSYAQLAAIMGSSSASLSRYLTGTQYPQNLRTLQNIERTFGWLVVEQVQLIPHSGHDMRYAMVLRQVLNEWAEANPRTVHSEELRALDGHQNRTARRKP